MAVSEKGKLGVLSVSDVRTKYGHLPNIVVFVAHPDDESMWCGGLLAALDSPTVIACSIPKRDPVRAFKFYDACDALGAVGKVLPHVETPQGLFAHLGLYTYLLGRCDLIVTHNSKGEYGHLHHMQLNQWVTENATCPVLCFGYGLHDGLEMPHSSVWAKNAAIEFYDHKSPTDGGLTKAAALRRVYRQYDLTKEAYIAKDA